MGDWDASWEGNRRSLLDAGIAATPAQRLAWLEEALELAHHASVPQRDAVQGLPLEKRRRRVRTLERLFGLFEGNDPEEEVRRLKAQDEGF